MPVPARQVVVPFADVREVPQADAPRGKMETQLVFGESFHVEGEEHGWCKGYCAHDEYRGYVHASHLAENALATTHVVAAARSHAYISETMKSPLVRTYSFGSKLRVVEEGEDYSRLEDGSWIYRKHLVSRASSDKDYIATAVKFLETPYYWGGRSGFGIDCSGLVQVALARAGIKAERDTDKQMDTIGQPGEAARRGDIIFFPGHVGIMVDGTSIIHANAFHMKVAIEPLETVAARSKGITAIRRLQLA